METQTFVFFGQVGSGKGAQVKLLSDYLKNKGNQEIIYGGTGDAFRNLLEVNNFTASLIKDSINKGELQPDFLTSALFANILIFSLNDQKHLITDGYPRTVEQSKDFEKMMSFFKRDNIKIIYIEISEEEAMKRNLLRGRADDTEESLKKRFNEYKNNVIPAMNYFIEKSGYKIFIINGAQSIKDVHQEIVKKLNF